MDLTMYWSDRSVAALIRRCRRPRSTYRCWPERAAIGTLTLRDSPTAFNLSADMIFY